MLPVLMLVTGLLGASPAENAVPATAADRQAYESARDEAGRDVQAHVKLALWCEAHGFETERLRHLATAVMIDPANTMARGLMGFVLDQGRWRKPTDVAARVEADAKLSAALADYNKRRAKINERSEDDQWKLALWCEEHGLEAEAKAHLTTVIRLNPHRDAAWKRLGCVNHNGRWATPETFAAEKAERIAQRKANAEWLPLLAKWKGWLRDPEHRAEAERNLARLDDPRAFPSVVKTFATPRPDDQAMAVQILGQIDSMPASRALAVIAVLGSTGEIRRAATETLRGRDVRSYAGDLIGLIREKVAYEFKPVNGPGQPGALLIKGDRVNHGRIYAPPPLPDFQLFPGEPIYYDDFGLPVVQRTTGLVNTQRSGGTAYVTGQQYINGSAPQLSAADQKAFSTFRNNPAYAPSVLEGHLWKAGSVPAIYPMQGSDFDVRLDRTITESRLTEAFIPIGRMIAETKMSAMVMQQQLKNDVMEIENLNQRIADDNARVVTVLNAVSGQDFGADRDSWKSWWSDQLGYSYVPPRPYPRPTLVEMVPPAYLPQPVQPVERLGPLASAKTDYSIRSELTQSGTDRFAAMGVYRCCFGAGTPVMTLTGPKPIEELRVGDRVLARNQETGGLSYRPILTVFHYPPTETLRLQVQGDSLVTSPLHRFWRVGDGWIMARDLKPGDAIRTLRGQVPVQGVEPDTKQPVFNLNVAEDSSFLVGQQGVLVHDNTLPDLLAKPFDVPATLARAGGAQ